MLPNSALSFYIASGVVVFRRGGHAWSASRVGASKGV